MLRAIQIAICRKWCIWDVAEHRANMVPVALTANGLQFTPSAERSAPRKTKGPNLMGEEGESINTLHFIQLNNLDTNTTHCKRVQHLVERAAAAVSNISSPCMCVHVFALWGVTKG